MRLKRRDMLAGLLASGAGFAQPGFAGAPERSLRPRLRPNDLFKAAVPSAENLIDRARLGGKVSFAVADAESGLVLEARNPVLPQPPASTAKALTALYALDALGPAYQFVTQIRATGPLEGGVVKGDLILAGGGDPVLDTDALGEMVASLKTLGVTKVTGKLKVWTGALPELFQIDAEQPSHVGYNPGLGGLNLNFNRVHFEWKRAGAGYQVGMEARSSKWRPDVTVARMTVIDRAAPVYTYDDKGGHDAWTVARRALGTGGARWLPVRRPGLYAGEVLQVLAGASGIAIGGMVTKADRAEGHVLVQHGSAALSPILRDMLKYSTNATAELVGMTATKARLGDVSGLAGSSQAMNDWLGETMRMRSARLEDHSGLGDDSRVSAVDMVKAMVATGPDGPLRLLLKPFDLRDETGYVVSAKTGTLNFVNGLTGFLDAPGNTRLAFAILCADQSRRDALSPAERERPAGGKEWAGRARTLQRRLLARWGTLYQP